MDESSTEKNIAHPSIKNTKNTVVLEDDDYVEPVMEDDDPDESDLKNVEIDNKA